MIMHVDLKRQAVISNLKLQQQSQVHVITVACMSL